MPNLDNLTNFGAIAFPSIDKNAMDLMVVCATARYVLPEPGIAHESAPQLSEEQQPPVMADEYWGEPDKSSLKYEGQSAYTRPCTDVYVTGSAWAYQEHAVNNMLVVVRIGTGVVAATVIGDRYWDRDFAGNLVRSSPQFFTQMPLLWENAFGGWSPETNAKKSVYEPRNPVGKGIYRTHDQAQGSPLPNIEHPRQLIKSASDRPEPIGFGPIMRSWQPRASFGGTYDEKWVRKRAPFWPLDFDERFFCAAPPSLQISPHLKGGERVRLEGLHPGGFWDFPLPAPKLVVSNHYKKRHDHGSMVLDCVQFHTDEGYFTMTWRNASEAGKDLPGHVSSLIRTLEPWEKNHT